MGLGELVKTFVAALIACRAVAADGAPSVRDALKISLRDPVPVTDGRARRLPPGARGSEIVTRVAGPDFEIEVTLNGLIGRDGRAFGFAQAKFPVTNVDVPLGRDRTRVGFRFRMHGTPGTRWQLVLSTDVSEARGDGEMLTYQAEFLPAPGTREVFVPLDAFLAVARGEAIPGEPSPGRLDYPANRLRVRALGIQLTRGGFAGGRDHLEPFRARLAVEGAGIRLETAPNP